MASDTSPRGHLILKSHKPLPRFACAIPVPHPDTMIQQLRSTVVAILSGQVSALASSKDSGAGASGRVAGAASANASSALSYSEHVKQVTIHEWRMKSLVLELRQNALIAPETRNAVDGVESEGNGGEQMSGFELLDEHECALLEHGDEVNLWLKTGQEIDSLRLPKLSSKHVFGLPNQPTLDRSGTLLGNPPAYSQVEHQLPFTSTPAPAVREPAEPSSHSSSVSAHPDVQFETTMRHWAPPNHPRVVVVNSSHNNLTNSNNNHNSSNNNNNANSNLNNDAGLLSSNNIINSNGNGNGNNKQQYPKKEKPKRLNSAGYFSPQMAEQKQRENFSHNRSHSGPIKVLATAQPSGSNNNHVVAEPASFANPGAHSSPLSSPTYPTSPLTSSTPAVAAVTAEPTVAAQLRHRQASFSKAEREKTRKAGMKKMPSDALIVGPGVQGKVGRMASFSSAGETKSSGGEEGQSGQAESYGNLDAFISFTAASSDVHQQARPLAGRVRRPSNRSGTSDKAINDGRSRPSETRRASGSSKADKKPAVLAPLTSNTRSSSDALPPMPMPRPVFVPSPNSEQAWQDNSPVAPVEALSHSPSPAMPSPSSHVDMFAESSDENTPATGPLDVLGEAVAVETSSKGLSKAEKRYQEVMRSLDAEKDRQAQDEKRRREAAIKREADKVKAAAKMEEEQRKKKEAIKWQVWEEVRARQAKEKAQLG